MVRSFKPAFVLCTLGVPLAIASSSSAAIADLKVDWSDSLNPIASPYGTWKLNQGNVALTHTNSWALVPAIDGWGPAANTVSNAVPFFFKTKTAALTNNTTGIGPDYQVGDVVMHSQDNFTGSGNGQGNITWTSPGEDTVAVTGNLWPTRINFARENKYALILNPATSATVLASGFVLEDGSITRSSPLSFNIPSLAIHTGDVLQLVIQQSGRVTGIQAGAGDFSGVNFHIASVPEPTSLLILAMGGALLLRKRRA